MLLRILSDLHTEFRPYKIKKLDEDSETVLILAGDCGLYKHVEYAKYIEKVASRFRMVLLVPGNHEFYKGRMPTEQDKFLSRINSSNLHILQNQKMDIDGILFVGGTLWTGFRNGNPLVMFDAEQGMNDYKKIRVSGNGYRKLRAMDILREHQITKQFIFDTVEAEKSNYEQIVVVTHHAPSPRSTPEQYKYDPLTAVYANDLDCWIENNSPTLWIHGHIHESKDYMIGDTRVLCNPKGYPTVVKDKEYHENMRFDPILRLML